MVWLQVLPARLEALLLWEPGLGWGQHGEELPEETGQSEKDDWQRIAVITLFTKRKVALKQPPIEGNTSTIRNEFLLKRGGLTVFTTVRSPDESQKRVRKTSGIAYSSEDNAFVFWTECAEAELNKDSSLLRTDCIQRLSCRQAINLVSPIVQLFLFIYFNISDTQSHSKQFI